MTIEELKVVISASTKGLEKGLKTVQTSVNKVTSSVSRMTNKMNSSFNSLGNRITKTFKSLANSAGLFLSIAGLIKLGNSALEAASDLEEVQNVVDTAFGSSANKINEWAKTTIESFGLTELQAKKYSSQLMAMSNSMGVARDEGAKMSTQLTEIAADLASFYNTSADQAFTAVNSVYTGETESLKKYGIVLTEANLQAFALSKGITKSYQAMTQAEKVALRYNYILSVTSDVQGDFAKTSGSWANQLKILKSQWTSLLSVLGQGLKEVLQPILVKLNQILASLITAVKAGLAFVGIDFSIDSASVTETADGVSDITDNIEEATEAQKKFVAGFDELNVMNEKEGTTSSGTGTSASSSIEITTPTVKTTQSENSIKKSLNDMLDKIIAWLEGEGKDKVTSAVSKITQKINEGIAEQDWEKIGTTIADALNVVTTAWSTFWTEFNGTESGEAFANLINGFVLGTDTDTIITGLSEKIQKVWDFIKAFIATLKWKDISKKLAETFSKIIITALNLLSNIIKGDGKAEKSGETIAEQVIGGFKEGFDAQGIKDAWNEFKQVFSDSSFGSKIMSTLDELKITIDELSDKIKTLGILITTGSLVIGAANLLNYLPVITDTGEKISSMFVRLTKEMGLFSGTGYIADAVMFSLKDSFATIIPFITGFGQAVIAFITNPITLAVAAVAALIGSFIYAYNTLDGFRAAMDSWYQETLAPLVADVKEWVTDIWENYLKPIWDNVKAIFTELWAILKSTIQFIGEAVGAFIMYSVNKLKPAIEFIWEVIKKIVSGTLGVLNGLLSGVRTIITGIRGIIEGLVKFINGVFAGDWKKAWEGIQEFFAGIWVAIAGIFKTAWNAFIGLLNMALSGLGGVFNGVMSLINNLVTKFNKIANKLGRDGIQWDWLSWNANWQIPYLANGGIIDRPTVAMLGEYSGAKSNPEIATPKSLLESIVNNGNDDLINVWLATTKQIISAIQEKDMNVAITDEAIANSVVRSNNRFIRRTGQPLLGY